MQNARYSHFIFLLYFLINTNPKIISTPYFCVFVCSFLGHYIDYGTPESSEEEFELDDEGQ
jgi:hypothetical protein